MKRKKSPFIHNTILYLLPILLLGVIPLTTPSIASASAEGTSACIADATFEFNGFTSGQAVTLEVTYTTGQSKTLNETADASGDLTITLPRYTYDNFTITAVIQNGDNAIGATADCPSISPSEHTIPVGEAFVCEPAFYQVLGGGLNRLDVETFEYELLGKASAKYNAIGYNVEDNYLYGIQRINNIPRLIQIDSNGVLFDLGQVDLGSGSQYRGDFDLEGNLVVTEGKFLYKIDVSATPPTVEKVQLTKVGSPSFNFHDITYNRVTGTFFTFTQGQVIEIDPAALTIEKVADYSSVADGKPYGAAFSDVNGDLYFSKNSTGAIYFADLDSEGNVLDFYPLADGGANGNNDGASCPNAAPLFEMACGDKTDNDLDGLIDEDDPDCFDEDGDNVPSIRDLDDDNDGIPDIVEMETALNNGDTDNDSIPDSLDLDSDGDGKKDAEEAGHGQSFDADGRLSGPFGDNGLADVVEGNDDGVINYTVALTVDTPTFQIMTDTDGDSVPDITDIDDDNDGIPDSHECSYSVSSLPIAVVNGSFESPDIDFSQDLFTQKWGKFPLVAVTMLESNINGWETTHSDDRIEIWQTGFNNVESYNGSQHAEINANGDAALFQDVATTPEMTMIWSFAHRGRSGPDTIQLNIGEPNGTLTTVATATTDRNGWVVYSGEYKVPAGQETTRFEYRAVSTASGNNTVGNFLDNIQFYIKSESVNCNIDTDGDNVIDSLDLDADGDGLTDAYEAGHSLLSFDKNGQLTGPVGENGMVDAVETETDSNIISYSIRDTNMDQTPNFQQFDDIDGDGVTADDIDFDNDGILNSVECSSLPCTDDFDGDGIPNAFDLDSDNDGWNDLHEIQGLSTYIIDVWLGSWLDVDFNGVIVGPYGSNGFANAIESDDTQSATQVGATPQDTDNDGWPNFLDLDSNGDNKFDIVAAGFPGVDQNNNGMIDLIVDDDFDGIPSITDGYPTVYGDNTPAALTVELYGSQLTAVQGDALVFTIVVENVGDEVAKNIDISSKLPAGLSHGSGETGAWSVAEIGAGERYSVTWNVDASAIIINQNYQLSIDVTGEDNSGDAIVTDQSALVAGDSDPDDAASTSIMGLGEVACETYSKNVAFEDLKNEGWSDWDYNDLIVKLEAELCFTPIPTSKATDAGAWTNIVNSNQIANSCSDINIEAETGSMTGFQIVNDEFASGGSYVAMPDLGIGDYTKVSAGRMVTYSVEIPTAGTYAVAGSTQGTGNQSDSFWFQMNDEEPLQWHVGQGSRYNEDFVTNNRNDNKRVKFDLDAGQHVMSVYNREDGTRLDSLSLQCLDAQQTPQLALASTTITYTLLARGAGFDHALRHSLPFEDGGQYMLETFDGDGVSLGMTQGLFDPNQPVEIFESSKVGLPPFTGTGDGFNTQTNTQPTQTDMTNGHSAVMTFVVNNPEEYQQGELDPFPWDLYLPVADTGQDVHLMIPGHMNNSQLVNSKYDSDSPLIGYNLPFGFTFDEEWTWPTEFVGIWNAYPQFVGYMDTGYSQNQNWFKATNSNGVYLWSNRNNRRPFVDIISADVDSRYTASPAVADMDGDGDVEIAIGDLIAGKMTLFDLDQNEIWSKDTNGSVRATAAVQDLDFDGDYEIIVGDESGYIHAWHHDGKIVSSFPISVTSARLLASPTVADINDDGVIEIVQVASNSQVYVYDSSSNLLWSADLSPLDDDYGAQTTNGSATVEDIDGDGDIEIVVPTQSGSIVVFDHTGNLVWSFGTEDAISSTPLVANFDPDNPGVEILFGAGDTYLYVLDQHGELLWRRSTGWIIRGSPVLFDSDKDGFPEVFIGSEDKKVHAFHYWADTVDGWPQETDGPIVSSPIAGDIDNDGESEIIVASEDGRLYAWEANGILVDDWPKQAGVTYKGSPVLTNADLDSAQEVFAADFGGSLVVIGVSDAVQVDDGPPTIYLPMVTR